MRKVRESFLFNLLQLAGNSFKIEFLSPAHEIKSKEHILESISFPRPIIYPPN